MSNTDADLVCAQPLIISLFLRAHELFPTIHPFSGRLITPKLLMAHNESVKYIVSDACTGVDGCAVPLLGPKRGINNSHHNHGHSKSAEKVWPP